MNQSEHLLRLFAEGDTPCTIYLLDHSLDFVFGGVVVLIGEVENRFGWILFDSLDDSLCQFGSAFAAMCIAIVDDALHPKFLLAMVNEAADLFVGVVGKAVEGHEDSLPETLHIGHMSVKVGKTALQPFKVRLLDFVGGHASVHLESIASADNYSEFWAETCLAAFDVEELLGAQVGTESCFSNAIVGQ